MRVNGFGATDQVQPGGINYAGGNPCFSEVTGQNIPGCTPPGSTAPANPPAPPAQTTTIPSWVWWVVGGLALVLFAGSEH